MTRKLLAILTIAWTVTLGAWWFTMGTAWAVFLTLNTYQPFIERQALRMCVLNGGNKLMRLPDLPSELHGWRCYNFTRPAQTADWIGPDIIARKRLSFEEHPGTWEIYEEDANT